MDMHQLREAIALVAEDCRTEEPDRGLTDGEWVWFQRDGIDMNEIVESRHPFGMDDALYIAWALMFGATDEEIENALAGG